MFTHNRTDIITFDMNEFSNSNNKFNRDLPHPMSTFIKIIGCNNETINMKLGNLVTLMGIFHYTQQDMSAGQTIDKFFNLLKAQIQDDQKSSGIVTKICGMS